MKKVYCKIALDQPFDHSPRRVSASDAILIGLLLGVVIGVTITAIVLS
jgi:hypothetical protein